MRTVYMFDGREVPEAEATISPLASGAMFGFGALDRLRGFRGSGGWMRIVGLDPHLERTYRTACTLFGDLPKGLVNNWREWIVCAVRASELDRPYIHISLDPVSSGTMLQSASGGLQTFIFVKDEGLLYGGEGLIVSSEAGCPRPDGLLVDHKVHGLYAELLLLKGRARARLAGCDPKRVEALLFARQAFRFSPERSRTGWVLQEKDPFVAEYGCSCAFSLDRNGDLHLPAPSVRYFQGITAQIVEALFEAYFPRRQIIHDLRRNHLKFNGGSAGTAGGVVPVVELDGQKCTVTDEFYRLAALYSQLCLGTLSDCTLQKQWAPVADVKDARGEAAAAE